MNNMANEFVKYTTDVGIAIYPHLTKPDTEYNKDGEYKVSLSLSEKEAAPLMKAIESEKAKAMDMIPDGKPQKEAPMPFFNEVDKEKQETGRVVFKFKMKAKVKNKQGETVELKPRLFDSQGTMFHPESVWGGSQIRVSSEIVPYYVPALGAGVSLRMKAVQIIDLKTGNGADASAYGFSATDGFTAPEEATTATTFADEDDDF
jgi:hypothetical protein